MTDTRFLPVDAPEDETVREPAKRWRNRYLCVCHSTVCEVCGDEHRYGDVWESCCASFPSKDAAETVAARELEREVREYGFVVDLYLGAFPDGEAP